MSFSFQQNALERIYFESFKKFNVQVSGFNHAAYSHDNTIKGKIMHRLYPEFYWDSANKKLLEAAEDDKPDILLIFKGMDIYPTTLCRLRDWGIKLVNYNPDHPFTYVSRGSGNRNVLSSIPFFDLHLTYSTDIAASFNKKYPDKKIEIVPFGFKLSDEEYAEFHADEEIMRACFIGYADRERASVVRKILDHGLELDVYGNEWVRYFPKPSSLLRIFPAESGIDYYRTMHRYRVQLNLFRGHNVNAHNMRSFEVPAAGGVMLAPDTPEHRKFFIESSEIFLYRTVEDIPEVISCILQLSDHETSNIRNNARSRSVNSGYDYDSRARVFLSKLSVL